MHPLTRRSSIVDTPFVIDLQKKFSNQVGFLPAAAIEDYATRGRIIICTENDLPAGYLLGKPSLKWCPLLRPITQAAICFDAQRRHLGTAMIDRIAADAIDANQLALQACCREGIEANEFWKAVGFEEICRLKPDNARRKEVIVWRRQLTLMRPAWFDRPPELAGWRSARPVVADK